MIDVFSFELGFVSAYAFAVICALIIVRFLMNGLDEDGEAKSVHRPTQCDLMGPIE